MRATSAVRPAPYPAMLDLDGRFVLIVGGGGVAARKAGAVLDAGAQLLIVAPTICPALADRCDAGLLRWEPRPAAPGDTRGAALVICAADSVEANLEVAAEARAAGIPVVVANAPAAGSALVPASLRRGRLVVAISTGGSSPSLSAFVRERIEEVIGEEYAELAELAEGMRSAGRAAGVSAGERERIAAAALPRLLELLRAGRSDQARSLAGELAITPVAGPAAPGVGREPAPEALSWS